MARVTIDTDGTFSGTNISADGNALDNIQHMHFSMWKGETEEHDSVSMSITLLEEDENGLMVEKRLVIAGTEEMADKIIAIFQPNTESTDDTIEKLKDILKTIK